MKNYIANREKYAIQKRKEIAFIEAVNKCDEYLEDPIVSLLQSESICNLNFETEFILFVLEILFECSC